MSQSDYINHKKQATVLRRQQDLESILDAQDYTNFKSFALVNTIIDENPTYNQLQQTDKERIFGMEFIKPQENCAEFKLCSNTDTRLNRRTTMTDLMGKRGMVTTRQHAHNEYKVRQKVNNLIMPCMMFDKCDMYLHNRRNMNRMVNT